MASLNIYRLVKNSTYLRPKQGFTVLELLVVIALLGILSAIVAPGWTRFLAKQQVTSVQGFIHQEVQQTQIKSQQNKELWQFSVREKEGLVEIAVHPVSVLPNTVSWRSFDKSVQLDLETTLLASGGIYYVRFDEKGSVRSSSLGRVTVSSKRVPSVKRCIIISTLLGATRTATEQPIPDPDYRRRDRFCY